MVEKCSEETQPKILDIICGVETGALMVDKFTRGGMSRCIQHPSVPDYLLNPIEFVALAGKNNKWKINIRSQDKSLQSFFDSKVLTDCPRQCSCEACEYSKSNPTDFGKVSLLVYGEGGSPVKAVNNESQSNGTSDIETNGTELDKVDNENNSMEEDILVDEFCSDASPKPKETDSKKKVVTNGTCAKPTQNGAKSADTNKADVKTADSKDGQKSSQPTPAKDDPKRVKQDTPDSRRKQRDIRSFFAKPPADKKEEEEKSEVNTSSEESDKPKSALRIKFEPGEMARINSIDSDTPADQSNNQAADLSTTKIAEKSTNQIEEDTLNQPAMITISEAVKLKGKNKSKKVEDSANTRENTPLPEVVDEFEKSFENKLAANGDTNVRRSKRTLDSDAIKEETKSIKADTNTQSQQPQQGVKRKRVSSPYSSREFKVKNIKSESTNKKTNPVKTNSTKSSLSKKEIPLITLENSPAKPAAVSQTGTGTRPKRTIVSPAKLQEPIIITLDSPRKLALKVKTEPQSRTTSPIKTSPTKKYESLLMTTPEKSKTDGQKSTPGRIKKEEYVLFKKSAPSAVKGKTEPTKQAASNTATKSNGQAMTASKSTGQTKSSKQGSADSSKSSTKAIVVSSTAGSKGGVSVKQEPGDGGRDDGEEGKEKVSPSKLPPYSAMIKHALSELNTVGGPGCTKLEILLFILRRYKPKDNVAHVTNKLLDVLEQGIKRGMLLSSASCTPRKRKDLNLKSPKEEKDEKTETKKSPNSPKKNVQTATTSNKSKVKKEPNTVASNNAKKKHASKNDEKVRKIGVTPKKLAEPLAVICRAKKLNRIEALKRVWSYIHSKKLLDPKDKTRIICDEKLKKLTKCKAIISKAVLGHVKNAMIAE